MSLFSTEIQLEQQQNVVNIQFHIVVSNAHHVCSAVQLCYFETETLHLLSLIRTTILRDNFL